MRSPLAFVIIDFYPRSPCGERPYTNKQMEVHTIFLSTLSLRRATPKSILVHYTAKFLSTLSLRRATLTKYHFTLLSYISIHALLAESDS